MFDAVSLYFPVFIDSSNCPKLMKEPLSVISIGTFSIVISSPVSGNKIVFFSIAAFEGKNSESLDLDSRSWNTRNLLRYQKSFIWNLINYHFKLAVYIVPLSLKVNNLRLHSPKLVNIFF